MTAVHGDVSDLADLTDLDRLFAAIADRGVEGLPLTLVVSITGYASTPYDARTGLPRPSGAAC